MLGQCQSQSQGKTYSVGITAELVSWLILLCPALDIDSLRVISLLWAPLEQLQFWFKTRVVPRSPER